MKRKSCSGWPHIAGRREAGARKTGGTSAPAMVEAAKKRPPDLPRGHIRRTFLSAGFGVRAQGLSPMAAVICASAASLPST